VVCVPSTLDDQKLVADETPHSLLHHHQDSARNKKKKKNFTMLWFKTGEKTGEVKS